MSDLNDFITGSLRPRLAITRLCPLSIGNGDRRVAMRTKRTERGPSGEETALAEVEMTEDPAEPLMTIEALGVVPKMTVLHVEGWMMIALPVGALTTTVAREGVEMMTAVPGVASMMTVALGVVLMMTEGLVEVWKTPEVPGVQLMMTGAPEEEEEMMTELEGEAWMTGHVMVVMTPNPGNHWADLVRLQLCC